MQQDHKERESERFCYEKLPFMEVLPIYKVHRVHNERDGPVTGYAILYDMKTIKKHDFNQIFQFNKDVFKNAKQLRKGRNLLKIKNYLRKGQQIFFVVQQFSTNLKNYIYQSNQMISQQKALNILAQVLQAIYSIINSRYTCIGIRPQHFVKVKEDWKLKSLVLNTSRRGFSSQFIWNPQFQPPQAYQNDNFTQEQLDNMVVWNIGSILIDLLAGTHVLSSKEIIKKFTDSNFDLKTIGIKKQINQQTLKFIKKSLAFSPKDRMPVQELFQWSWIKDRIKQNKKYQPEQNSRKYLAPKNLMTQIYNSNIESNVFNPSPSTQEISKIITDREIQTQSQNLKGILRKYNLQIDIATFLTTISDKISYQLNQYYGGQVNEKSLNKPFMNFISLSFMGLIVINKVKQSLFYFQNVYFFKSDDWNKFINSKLYSALKIHVQQVYKQLQTHYQQFLLKAKDHIKQSILPKDFKQLMSKYHQKTTMDQIKDTYRKILSQTLKTLNKQAKKNIRSMTLVLYSLLFNKTHDNQIQERQDFLQFMKQQYPQIQNQQFTIQKYKNFILYGKKSIVNNHFRFLNRKYLS